MGLEDDLNELYLQLDSIQDVLKSSPDNAELLALQDELKVMISATEEQLRKIKPSKPAATSEQAGSADANHSATRKRPAGGAPPPTTEVSSAPQITYNVGDSVQARWVSGDNSFYPARITSITGSTKNPVYIVTYTSYGTTETLTSKDIKPAQSSHASKKARTSPPAQPAAPSSSSSLSTPAPVSSAVISQAPTLNPSAFNSKQNEVKPVPLDGNSEKKKKKGSKFSQELDQSKKKWADFASKGVKSSRVGKVKKIGEGSMFRVPEGVHGRVGFTGSGQPMRKDVARERHIYQQGETNDD